MFVGICLIIIIEKWRDYEFEKNWVYMGGVVVGKLKGGNDVYNIYVMFIFDLKNFEKICVNSDWVLV